VLVVWILLAFLACLLALLAVPVDLTFFVRRHAGRPEITGTVCWFFGLARLRLGKAKARVRAKPARSRDKRRHRKRGGARRMMAMFRSQGFGWRVLRLAQDLLRRIDIRDLSMNVRLGLDDPADTGRLWAVVGPLAAMLALLPATCIAIEPEFTSEAFEIDAKGDIRIIPIQLLWVMLIFVLSPGTLRVLYALKAAA